MREWVGLFLLVLPLATCAPPPRAQWQSANPASWLTLRQALERERTARPRDPWAAALSVTMQDPRSGRVIDGRGGIAVAPGRAVRMILVGPAGVTILDAWVTPSRWRVAVPPLDLIRRGGADEPGDLPVGFLRWWFFTPFEGTLFAATLMEPGMLWLLRDGDAVIELRVRPCPRGERWTAARRAHGRTEQVDECRALPLPRPGDSVRYADEANGMHVDIVLESVAGGPPEEEAFRDPDAPQGGS
jgi:hypothetical protein